MDIAAEERYQQKISVINGIDPYKLNPNDMSSNPEDFPRCTIWWIGSYLVFKASYYTQTDFNAYKSLNAYNQFACGWVRDVHVKIVNDWHVVTAKVMHSMRLSEDPLETWIIAAKSGEINSAHCSCMAGLGEACIHVAAVLFYIESYTQHVEEKSVTDVAAYWTPPAAVNKAPMAPVDDINFTKKRLCENQGIKNRPKKIRGTETSEEEFKEVLDQLAALDTPTPIAILLTTPPYCYKYENPRFKEMQTVCSNSEEKYPPKITDLFRENLQNETLENLLAIAETMTIETNPEQCTSLEKDTRLQAKSKLWFQYRAGRITASVLKRVCSASLSKPPLSLIKQIVYPERMKFSSRATQWGCTHEENASNEYYKIQQQQHTDIKIRNAGLYVCFKIPYVGATPDGIVSCRCCGTGCIEIKCPYCLREAAPEELLEKSNYLDAASKSLKKGHMYYYQVQMHLFVTELKYCDFVVWTKNGIHIERIFLDQEFWSENQAKVESFHKKVLLPEVLGRYYTSSKNNLGPGHKPTIVRL